MAPVLAGKILILPAKCVRRMRSRIFLPGSDLIGPLGVGLHNCISREDEYLWNVNNEKRAAACG